MMAIIFILLILLGVLQLWLIYRQRQRTQRLRLVEAMAAHNTVSLSIRRFPLGYWLIEIFNDIRFHLIGKKGNMLLQHVIIILVAQIIGFYISQEYLHLNIYFVSPSLLLLSLYALYLRARQNMRKEFETEFSEALNIINSAIRAGNTVTQGIAECGRKLDKMIGEEFRQISQRLDIGEDVENVFMDSYHRLPYREYYFFIITVLINMKGGGQVREVMSRLATIITDGRVIERKKYALTAEVRVSIKVLTAIPIFFFFFLKYQSPSTFAILLYNPTGQLMLYYAIASILLGLLIVWMMMNKI